MSIVTLDSDFIHYEVLGRGRPIIFLHGWVGSWRYWIPTMQAASISYRTYAIDLWGFGDSAKRADKYSLDSQSKLVYSFMDAMGIGRIALVGHGLGALVALNFMRNHASLVDRLCLTALPMSNTAINPRLKTASVADLADWLLGKVPETQAARIEAPKADIAAIHTSLDSLRSEDILSQVIGLRTPCVFVHGLLDPVIELPAEDLFPRLPENTHQVVFEASGHFPMLDELSKYNRLLADFLALPSGESPRTLQLKEEWKRRIR
jgi:pimeloyl-ACP methyl ester carboxylesterase